MLLISCCSMLIALVTGFLIAWRRPPELPAWLVWSGLALSCVI